VKEYTARFVLHGEPLLLMGAARGFLRHVPGCFIRHQSYDKSRYRAAKMAECQCTSKKHGHGDRCSRPVNGQADFCDECQQQMIVDRVTQDQPNLTPAEGPLPEKT
jgi:hypothetical protein